MRRRKEKANVKAGIDEEEEEEKEEEEEEEEENAIFGQTAMCVVALED